MNSNVTIHDMTRIVAIEALEPCRHMRLEPTVYVPMKTNNRLCIHLIDETEKFKKAFKDPEFRKLFEEYLDEMQNPANRLETEAYISQLENENKVPEGKELIR